MKRKIKSILEFVFLLLILITPQVSAVKVNFLSYRIEKQECSSLISSIPEKYLEGISGINIFEIPKTSICGHYFFFSHKINLYCGCDINILIHELAHHKNARNLIPYWRSAAHGIEFYQAYDEIRTEYAGRIK